MFGLTSQRHGTLLKTTDHYLGQQTAAASDRNTAVDEYHAGSPDKR